MRTVFLSVVLSGLALGPGCSRPTTPPTAPEPTDGSAPAAAPSDPAPALDREHLRADIVRLASDELRGRWTLSPELLQAADFLAERHAELGSVPVASSFLVDFPISVGTLETTPTTLTVVRGGRPAPLAAAEFAVVPQSGSGEVRGPVVFVGYGALAEATKPEDDKPGSPAYDDLAGLDLKGKIAVVLLDAPGRPDPITFFRRLQAEQQTFNAAAAPLKEKKDAAALLALHGLTRARLLALMQRYLPPGADLKDMWPAPADPLTVELDLQVVVAPAMREAGKLKGPRFAFNAGSLKTKVERLAKVGATAVIVVRGPRSFLSDEDRAADDPPPLVRTDGTIGEPFAVPVVQLKWKAADRLLRVGKSKKKISDLQNAIDSSLTPRSGEVAGLELELKVAVEPVHLRAPNVVAKIPGSDLADEIVVLGAHYDHIGVDGQGECNESRRDGVADAICNGADDNASGTAMLLELARHFHAQKPRRTIVFAHFAGEEMGLLGSKAMADQPPFALEKVVAMVNLDMIGRLGPKGLAIGGLVSSDAWMPLLDKIGTAGLDILYDGSVASRSDHASFYRKNLPVLFFFTGTHADYHRPTDHADKINYDGLMAIGSIIHGVARALADGHAVPYKQPPASGGIATGLPGSNPDTVVKRVPAKE